MDGKVLLGVGKGVLLNSSLHTTHHTLLTCFLFAMGLLKMYQVRNILTRIVP